MIVIFDHFCNSFQYYITHNLLDDFLANGNSMPNCNFLVLEILFQNSRLYIMIADGGNLKHQRVSFSSFKYCWQNMTWPRGLEPQYRVRDEFGRLFNRGKKQLWLWRVTFSFFNIIPLSFAAVFETTLLLAILERWH